MAAAALSISLALIYLMKIKILSKIAKTWDGQTEFQFDESFNLTKRCVK